ncbi:MAG: Bax inhibitor-1/YccA family protein [Phycisphaerales bacterium]|nr:Bax inhibitor-1/YccA family protein [Phycisphaerales bacterium]
MLKSNNPALKAFSQPQTWNDFGGGSATQARSATMTIAGTVQAAGIQLALAFAGAVIAWMGFSKGWLPASAATPMSIGVMGLLIVGGFVLARKPASARVMGPIMSGAYGAFAGLFSYAIAMALGAVWAKNPELIGAGQAWTREALVARGSGVIMQAMLLTIGVAGAMLLLRVFNIVRVGGVFAKIVMFATLAVGFVYIASMLLRLITGTSIPFIHQTGPIGIGFSAFVVVLASINLLMAFQTVEDGARAGLPKFMEWYAGYAVVSTIIWLYIEILHLLYKIYASMSER